MPSIGRQCPPAGPAGRGRGPRARRRTASVDGRPVGRSVGQLIARRYLFGLFDDATLPDSALVSPGYCGSGKRRTTGARLTDVRGLASTLSAYRRSKHTKLVTSLTFNVICCTVIGPIPWGHSGPICHALSLSSSSSLSSLRTSMPRRRATVQWLHLVNWREAARCGEWAQHFSNASC